MEYFAGNLKRLLAMHDVSSKEAAAMLGLSESALTKWLQGHRRPSFESAMEVADLFGVRPEKLAREPFEALLPDLADVNRFRATEAVIASYRQPVATVTKLKVGVRTDTIPKGKTKGGRQK